MRIFRDMCRDEDPASCHELAYYLRDTGAWDEIPALFVGLCTGRGAEPGCLGFNEVMHQARAADVFLRAAAAACEADGLEACVPAAYDVLGTDAASDPAVLERALGWVRSACAADRANACAVFGMYLADTAGDVEGAEPVLRKGCELGNDSACTRLDRGVSTPAVDSSLAP
jgi:TPR repeat protein